jgi:Carboxypeptidase regulatory-like domain/IPT/TIG domain
LKQAQRAAHVVGLNSSKEPLAMATSSGRELYARIYFRFGLGLLLSLFTVAIAQSQSATYHLHNEASGTRLQLKTANPDAASVSIQSTNLKNSANGEYLIREFDTLSGVPNVSGIISSGATVSVDVWMKKTASAGTMFPRVKINLNSSGGASLGVITGTTQLSTTLTKYTLTGTVPANVSMTTSDRFYLWVGVNLTAATSVNNRGELDIEGTVNGNYDSLMTVPLPTPAPSISNLSPNNGPVGTSVTITGTNFNATQGTSTVTFNGVSATPTNWSATSISVPVPSSATTGPVVVTVNSQASNGSTFTVKPNINNLSPTTGSTGTAVTITGTTFGSTQGTSTVTFNGTAATPTSWNATSIAAPVPSGATTGPVVVTVNSQASNGATFTISTTGSITGTITRSSDNAPINGALVEAMQTGSVIAFTSSAANGTYTISSLNPGTYDVRVSAIGYQTVVQTGVVVTTGSATTVDKSLVSVSGTDITYIYDALSRLVGVVSPTEVATYSYDSVGNLLSISRGNAALLAVIEFTPNNGAVGTEVTIFGTAFSSTPTNNTVKFNGVTATVTSSTATQIVTTVPAGATTGPISVTTSTGTAVSSSSFVVSTSALPTITGFSPNTGSLGTTVTVTGTNFDPVAQNNKMRFSQAYSAVINGTTTSLDSTFTAIGASGHVGVVTSEGTAESTADFFYAPPPYVASDIGVTGRIAVNTLAPITISTPGKIAILVFEGVAGQRLHLGLSAMTLGPSCCSDVGTVAVFRPNGSTQLAAVSFPRAGWGSGVMVLPTTGTYAILIDPVGSNTGSVTVSVAPEIAGSIGINAQSKSLNFTAPGQQANIGFSGTAGQLITLGFDNVTIGGACCVDVATVTIYLPDNTPLFSASFNQTGYGSPTIQLPLTATYRINIDPTYAFTGGATMTLSDELAAPITMNGPPLTLNLSRAGQNARLSFSGTAGQVINVGLSGITIGTSCCTDPGYLGIVKPDGTALLQPSSFSYFGWSTTSLQLPASGTYAITIDPAYAKTGDVTVTLSEELAVPITIDGPTVPINFNRVGQIARLSFTGTAGQRVSVGLSNVSIGGSCCVDVAIMGIYNPDGSVLFSPISFNWSNVGTPTVVLPVSGTYSIVIDPTYAFTGGVTVTLSSELAPPITIDGPPVALNFDRAGMNARLPFSGTAGQRVSVGVSNVSIGGSCCVDVGIVGIYKPDGSVLLSPISFNWSNVGTPTVVLPVDGTYTIGVDPTYAFTGGATVTLSSELAPPITIDGPPVTLNFDRAGMNARLPFSGTAGQHVSVGVGNVSIGGSCCVDVGIVGIYKPDGTVLFSPVSFNWSNVGTATVVLPVSGTYTIVVDPTYAFTGSATVTISSELAPPITINGAPVVLNFDRAGMNARLPFSGTANQRISVGVSNVSIGGSCCVDVGILTVSKPDGSDLVSQTGFNQSGATTASVVLPVSGTFSIAIDPTYAFTGNATVTLSEDQASSVTINGSTVPLSITRVGQNANLTFDGTSGAQVTVRITGNAMGSVTVRLVSPSGTVLTSSSSASASFNLSTQILPTTGVYTIIIDPNGLNTGNITIGVTTP